MSTDETPGLPARVGTSADLARRMDRMEQRQDGLEQEVRTLSATVARVELNQKHADELSSLRHEALDKGLASLNGKFDQFVDRIEGIINGDIQTPQQRAGVEMVAEWKVWRADVDEWREGQEAKALAAQGRKEGWQAIGETGRIIVTVFASVAGSVASMVLILKGLGVI